MGNLKLFWRIGAHSIWWVGRGVAYARRGIVSRSNNWALGASFAVAFCANLLGIKMLPQEGWHAPFVSGVLGLGAAWSLLFVARLLIAPFRMWAGGKWYGNEYIYDEPKTVFSVYAKQEQNNFIHRFHIPDAPPLSFIHYQIELDGPKTLIRCLVAAHQNQIPRDLALMTYSYGGGSIRVGNAREMCMAFYLDPRATPFSVRIKITGWENPTAKVWQDL